MFFLKRNLPTWERALRIAAGLLIAGAVLVFSNSGMSLKRVRSE